MAQKLEEWFLKLPWGNIALASWGSPRGEPVLMVHGSQDSMSTFEPLLQLLPAKYYYVAMDLPGNGKSDALPIGISIPRISSVSAIYMVVKLLKWNKFIFMGHSMGAELGLFYNIIYPGKVSKFIFLDIKPGLQWLQITDLPQYFKNFYAEYYNNYTKYNVDDRRYTKEAALRAVMKARSLTRDQSELVLERNLKSIGGNKFQLSWDKRQKIVAPVNFPPEFYMEIFSKNMAPSLFINAKQSKGVFYVRGRDEVDRICAHLEKNMKNMYVVEMDGTHNVHYTHPERVESEVAAFLDRNFECKSKL